MSSAIISLQVFEPAIVMGRHRANKQSIWSYEPQNKRGQLPTPDLAQPVHYGNSTGRSGVAHEPDGWVVYRTSQPNISQVFKVVTKDMLEVSH